MIRVLFVDDEARVLSGLRRSLRRMRAEWDVACAASGQAALEALERRTFDVVVADMRMAGIDGAEVLRAALRNDPRTLRLALTGHTSERTVLRAVPLTHQYLAKPCDIRELAAVIRGVQARRQRVPDPEIQRRVSGLACLPSVPEAWQQMVALASTASPSLRGMARLVARDVAMRAKVLQLTGSGFFGCRSRPLPSRMAVALLGAKLLRRLVLQAQVVQPLKAHPRSGFDIRGFSNHGYRTAAWARTIARAEGLPPALVAQVSIAGMLHDAGRVALAAQFPLEYRGVIALARGQGITLEEAERRVFGTTHAEVGALLLGQWGIDASVVDAVARHHRPKSDASGQVGVLAAVHVANAIDHRLHPVEGETAATEADGQYLRSLGLEPRVAVWEELCRRRGWEKDFAPWTGSSSSTTTPTSSRPSSAS
ncbi:MAG: HDOD domain-containing protein [Candidatus Brocadiia bacterium]